VPTQELPPLAARPFIVHAAHRQRLAQNLPPLPLPRAIPGTGEGASAGMIIVTLCLAGAVSGIVHVGWQAPGLWPTAALLAALDGWFFRVMIRLARAEERAKRLYEQGQTLRGTVVRCFAFDQSIPPSSWEGSPESHPMLALEYSFRTPAGREIVHKEQRFAEDVKGQPLPEPGTPVLFMYLDDAHYEIL
jgi:hypothetical protein